MSEITLDAGPLIRLDRDDRRVILLLARAARAGARVVVPAPALAQAVRNPAQQARLARVLRQPLTEVAPLDRAEATRAGQLLAQSRVPDIVDAHVVVCARRSGTAVLTTDPKTFMRSIRTSGCTRSEPSSMSGSCVRHPQGRSPGIA